MKADRLWERAFGVLGLCFVVTAAAYFALPENSRVQDAAAFAAACFAVLCLVAVTFGRKSQRLERTYEINDVRREIDRNNDDIDD